MATKIKKLRSVTYNLIKENNITEEQFNEITESPYRFTKDTMTELDLKEINEEDFYKQETNFIYKFIGKFYTDYKTIKSTQNRILTFLKKNKWKK
jgi:hypothetical protein